MLFLTDCKDTPKHSIPKDKNHTNIFTDTVRLDHKEQFDQQTKEVICNQTRMAVCPKEMGSDVVS